MILRVLLYFYPETQGFSCPLKVRRIRIGSELVVIPARLTSEPSRKTKWVASFRLSSTWTIYGYHLRTLCPSVSNNSRMILLSYLIPSYWIRGFPPIVGIRWFNLLVLAVAPALALYGFIALSLRKETMLFSLSYYLFSMIGDRLS